MKRIFICIACLLLLAGVALAQTPTQKTVVTLGPGTHTVTIPISDPDPVLNYLWVRTATCGAEDWTQPQTLPGTATQIVDSGVPGGTWCYQAKGVESGGTSPTSNEVSALVPMSAPALGTPVVSGN